MQPTWPSEEPGLEGRDQVASVTGAPHASPRQLLRLRADLAQQLRIHHGLPGPAAPRALQPGLQQVHCVQCVVQQLGRGGLARCCQLCGQLVVLATGCLAAGRRAGVVVGREGLAAGGWEDGGWVEGGCGDAGWAVARREVAEGAEVGKAAVWLVAGWVVIAELVVLLVVTVWRGPWVALTLGAASCMWWPAAEELSLMHPGSYPFLDQN
jgi:hypothetical protein